jgi:hypothetical protein
MKLPAMIICHKSMLHQNKKQEPFLNAPCQRVYFVVTSPKKLGYAYLTTNSRLGDVIFLALKYDVFRNGAVIG